MIELKFSNQSVKIDAGELVGYKIEGHQYIHQKGSLGWQNSDTEMFPIIGPTAEAVQFKISTVFFVNWIITLFPNLILRLFLKKPIYQELRYRIQNIRKNQINNTYIGLMISSSKKSLN